MGSIIGRSRRHVGIAALAACLGALFACSTAVAAPSTPGSSAQVRDVDAYLDSGGEREGAGMIRIELEHRLVRRTDRHPSSLRVSVLGPSGSVTLTARPVARTSRGMRAEYRAILTKKEVRRVGTTGRLRITVTAPRASRTARQVQIAGAAGTPTRVVGWYSAESYPPVGPTYTDLDTEALIAFTDQMPYTPYLFEVVGPFHTCCTRYDFKGYPSTAQLTPTTDFVYLSGFSHPRLEAFGESTGGLATVYASVSLSALPGSDGSVPDGARLEVGIQSSQPRLSAFVSLTAVDLGHPR